MKMVSDNMVLVTATTDLDETKQHNKKRKLNDTTDIEIGAIKHVSTPTPPPTYRTMATGATSNTNVIVPNNNHIADKALVRQLLEPFTVDQLIEILSSAATQHIDIYNEIKAVASTDIAHRKVFVRGLAWETSTEQLKAAFATFGEVEEGAVIFDKTTGKSRGYGFVTFIDMDAARRAVEKQTIEIDGRTTTCNLAAVRGGQEDTHTQSSHVHSTSHHHSMQLPLQPFSIYQQPVLHQTAYAVVPTGHVPPQSMSSHTGGGHDEADRKLFVRGLSWDSTDDSLRATFHRYGELVEASVVRERKTGKSKGFGFVTYKHRASADYALQQPQKFIDGRNVTCNLASLGKVSAVGQPAQVAVTPPQMPMQPGTYVATYPQMQPAMMQQHDAGAYGMYVGAVPPTGIPPSGPYPPHQPYQYGPPPTHMYYAPPPAPLPAVQASKNKNSQKSN